MRKISNVKAAGSVVTSVLKKLSQLSGKAIIAYHKITVTTVIRQLLVGAEAYEVRCQATGISALNS